VTIKNKEVQKWLKKEQTSIGFKIALAEQTIIDCIFAAMDETSTSKAELARRSGVSRKTIERILSAGDSPTVATLTRLLDAMKYKLEAKVL